MDLLTARSTSRSTWGEWLAFSDISRIIAVERSMPLSSSSAYSLPERMSRGAIKHGVWCRSRRSHILAAVSASAEECDIKICIIASFQQYQTAVCKKSRRIDRAMAFIIAASVSVALITGNVPVSRIIFYHCLAFFAIPVFSVAVFPTIIFAINGAK